MTMTDTVSPVEALLSTQTEEAGETPEPTEAADTAQEAPEAGEGEAEAEVAQQILDLAEVGDHLVTVKVNGEEFTVPLSEAVKGYMRQDAFTRKTQSLAEQAKSYQHAAALVQQLERDPEGTIQRLADAYGFSGGDDGEEPDPNSQQLTELQRRLDEIEMARVRTQIDAEMNDLHARYGEFDEDDLIAFARQRQVTIPEAYAIMNFDLVRTARQSKDTITQAKRQAQVVSGTGSTQSGVVGKPKVFKDAREAIVAALRDQGVKV